MSTIHIYHNITDGDGPKRLLATLCEIHDTPETRAEYGMTTLAIVMAELEVPEPKDWCFRCQEIRNQWRNQR